MNKIDTVVIVNDFNYINGGAAKVAIETAELLLKKGINVYFFSAENLNKDKIDGVNYVSTNQKASLDDKNKLRGALNGIWNIKAYKELKKLLSNLDKEKTIIHIHGWMKALSSSIFVAIKKMNFNHIVTYHDYFSYCPNGGFYNYKKNEICRLKPLSKKCILCNCDSRNYVLKIYRIMRHIVQNKIVKINELNKNIISISDFSYNILRDSISKNAKVRKIYNPIDITGQDEFIDNIEDNKYYLYVGRISKEKGVKYFCEAIKKLNYKGIVVGDGPQKKDLEKMYPDIEFTGWKSSDEVRQYMRKARALIFPSIWYEGAPLTILEAQKMGLPVIVSDCCAGIEFVSDDQLIFKSKNIDDLVEKILKLQKNLAYISKEVYKKSNKQYNKLYIEQIIEFYNFVGAKDES